jgi:hypothetical protein
MEVIQAYKCSFCSMVSALKSSTVRHEKNCYKNPASRSCQTCRFFFITQETYYNPYHGGDPGSTDYEYDVMCCEHEEGGIDHKRTHCDKYENANS